MSPHKSCIAATLLCALTAAAAEPPSDGTATAQARFAGVDLSYVNELESCGAEFRADGRLRDPFELFAERGANLVRLRLWHTPDWTTFSTESDVARSIERARRAGMQVLLDIPLLGRLGRSAEADDPGGLGGGHRRSRGAGAASP